MSPADYQGKRDWLRSHPHGPQAQMIRRELRAWERRPAPRVTNHQPRLHRNSDALSRGAGAGRSGIDASRKVRRISPARLRDRDDRHRSVPLVGREYVCLSLRRFRSSCLRRSAPVGVVGAPVIQCAAVGDALAGSALAAEGRTTARSLGGSQSWLAVFGTNGGRSEDGGKPEADPPPQTSRAERERSRSCARR